MGVLGLMRLQEFECTQQAFVSCAISSVVFSYHAIFLCELLRYNFNFQGSAK